MELVLARGEVLYNLLPLFRWLSGNWKSKWSIYSNYIICTIKGFIMGQPEAKFQKKFVDDLKQEGFKCIRVKASGNYNKAYPDYAIFYGPFWAWLEFKRSADAPLRPGQQERVDWAAKASWGSLVYPENAGSVMRVLLGLKKKIDKNGKRGVEWIR